MTTPTPPLPDLLRAAANWLAPGCALQEHLRAAADRLEAEQPATATTTHKVTQTGEHFCQHFCEERKRLGAEVAQKHIAQGAVDAELQRLRDELTMTQQRENEGVALFDKLLAEERAMVTQLRAENEKLRQQRAHELANPLVMAVCPPNHYTLEEFAAARAETALWRDRAEWLLGEMRKEADRG